jgi:tRNA (cmo5U34)-methyltransferase
MSTAIQFTGNGPAVHPKSSLGHRPTDRWQFDDGVVDVFDDMLSRSIPQIESMREVVNQLAKRVIQPQTDVVDLGCATGEGIAQLLADKCLENRFVAVETSEPMLRAAQRRLEKDVREGRLELSDLDLRKDYPAVSASLTLCVLTLQFIPIEYRQRVLSRVFSTTVPGGGMILVEKVLGESSLMNSTLTAQYYDHKRAMGYSENAIETKRVALEGVLVPLTASWNEQLLRDAGFHHVECVWRCLNFCAWLAIS